MAVWEFIRHLDDHILQWITQYGAWTYGILFLIVFCETGLVIMPFLPGDTLLFAAGLFSRPENNGQAAGFNIWIVLIVLTIAPVAGDNVNYFFGKWLGPKLFKNPRSKFFKRENLDKTHEFFDKYGSKTVILARWVPIVRTFAPFVAGMGAMPYRKFLTYSIAGAVLWVWTLVGAGYMLGRTPWVRDNFELAMIFMIAVTGGPVLIEVLRKRRKGKVEQDSEPITGHDSPKRVTNPD
jgi:membrane-associated protein